MNLTKFLKAGLLTFLVLALGLVLYLTVDFNKSFDYTGGTVVSVSIKDTETSEAVEKINQALKDNNLNASSIVKGENENGVCFIIKYQIFENINIVNENFKNDLFQSFGYDITDALEESYIIIQTNTSPEFGTEILLKAFLAILVGLVAVALYMFARHNRTSGFAMIAVGILDLGLMLALTLISRLPISGYFIIAILGTVAFSIYASFMQLNTFNTNAKDEKLIKLSNGDITELSVNEQTKKIMYIAFALTASMLILGIWIGGMGFTLLSLVLGLNVCVLSTRFITPALWALAFHRKTKKQKTISKSEKEIPEAVVLPETTDEK